MLLVKPVGRDYLARLVLYGLQGQITANGKTFNGSMPAWGETLDDAQLAGALDYVLHSWNNDQALPSGFRPFTPTDIADARNPKLTADQVYALRGKLMPAVLAPAEAIRTACIHPGTGGSRTSHLSSELPGLSRRQSERRRIRWRTIERPVLRPTLGQRQCRGAVWLHAGEDAAGSSG